MHVVGTKIYFPTAREVVSGSTVVTTPGIGCWDTSTETPCAFIPLPGGPVWTGSLAIYGFCPLRPRWPRHILLPELPPTRARQTVYVRGRLVVSPGGVQLASAYCVPLSWLLRWLDFTDHILLHLTSAQSGTGDMMLEETGRRSGNAALRQPLREGDMPQLEQWQCVLIGVGQQTASPRNIWPVPFPSA